MAGHGKDEDWAEDDEQLDNWIKDMLRTDFRQSEADAERAIARYHASVRRMETDPEYAAHIQKIIDEVDADLAAEKEQADDGTGAAADPGRQQGVLPDGGRGGD